ncbi:MAG: NAD(P)H-dependent oxidoreductase [Actinomycetota bacterium]
MSALVVLAHPRRDSYTAALAHRAVDALGPSSRLLDLYRSGFDPTMDREEHRRYLDGQPPTDPIAAEHARLLASVEHVVFVYPTWWGTVPAMLKGWLDRVLAPEVAFTLTDRWPHVRPALTNVRAVTGIATYGSPRWNVRLINDGGRRTLTRAMRLACGWRTRTRWLALYALDNSTAADREAFSMRVEHTLRDVATRVPR